MENNNKLKTKTGILGLPEYISIKEIEQTIRDFKETPSDFWKKDRKKQMEMEFARGVAHAYWGVAMGLIKVETL